MRFLRRRRKYGHRADAAEAEVHLSRQRLDATHKNVTAPLRETRRRNQFAEIIRSSLMDDYNHHEKA